METRVLQQRQGCRAVVDGNEVVIFSSNDYLGLSAHPDVIQAAADAARQFGIGTGGAPGTTGTTTLHLELSRAVAAFKSRERATLFPSGYQANVAIHHALASDQTVFHLDKRHHPSAIDGVRIGKPAGIFRFDHNDLKDLEKNLRSNKGKTNVVSLPSVFTVDGDIAPLDRIAELKKKHRFALILDEAHATGCVGMTGRGLEEHFGLHGTADFIMGSFSKALGSQGGFVAYDGSSGKLLKTGFRQFEYSTSLSTVSVAAALKALQILQSDERLFDSLKTAKSRIIEECGKHHVRIISRESMILLLPCDNQGEAVKELLKSGFFVVPAKAILNGREQDCLRITPMALHTEGDIKAFAESLAAIVRQS